MSGSVSFGGLEQRTRRAHKSESGELQVLPEQAFREPLRAEERAARRAEQFS
jgi:hypothetical protein